MIVNRLKVSLCAFVFICIAFDALAKEVRYKDYPLELRESDRLVFFGVRGNVRVQPSANGKTALLKARKVVSDKSSSEDLARFEAMSFAVRRDGNTVIVEMKGPDSKSAWGPWLRSGAPELHLEIEAPPIPIEILEREGQVSIINWRQAVAINLVSGAIKTQGTDGLLRLQLQQGQIGVERHRGRVEIDSYSAKLGVQELEGDLDLTNFAGESTLGKIKGNVELKSHSGPMNVMKSSGAIEFQAGRGAVNLNGFEGPVRGKADQAAVSVIVEGEAEVNIESVQGPVTVKLPSDSGAAVRMQTDEGSISVPDAVRAPGTGQARVVNGRLAGSGPKGAVVVKSKAGTLRVRI